MNTISRVIKADKSTPPYHIGDSVMVSFTLVKYQFPITLAYVEDGISLWLSGVTDDFDVYVFDQTGPDGYWFIGSRTDGWRDGTPSKDTGLISSQETLDHLMDLASTTLNQITMKMKELN